MTIKQMIVMRRDLNMRRGKQISQGAHASMAVLLNAMETDHSELFGKRMVLSLEEGSPMDLWLTGLFTKVCVSVDSEEELDAVYLKAKEAGIPCALITDAGLTEFNGVPTKTCCAIGPAESEVLDGITGGLKLL